jgi:hypothetical protein
MTQRIVGITFKGDARLVTDHPDIERIMQKEITEQGTHYRPLGYPLSLAS